MLNADCSDCGSSEKPSEKPCGPWRSRLISREKITQSDMRYRPAFVISQLYLYLFTLTDSSYFIAGGISTVNIFCHFPGDYRSSVRTEIIFGELPSDLSAQPIDRSAHTTTLAEQYCE
ncbi:uncharacterized protein LOC113559707 [Rhopalosiphum maidis]|uniref:uncharacterized protein LOC113559704 n=1 Tax=Rhopalosiphum maidis TaxID=43146 RepID=UPI000EFE95D5|nr:uncharacterized protein LOC113559704 [Rhopalosiphum maidis]XP_026821252.1 uncharacterized protein LOC113559707 [Rhopalosiphum maidis]